MDLVILDGFETENTLTMALQQTLEKREDVTWFKLKDYEVKPCNSCGSCSYKTCGKCIIKDDFEAIVKVVANCKTMILLTPIRFGGYSSQLKKVIDRCMILGVPLYMVKKGHLLHPMRYDIQWVWGIGLSEDGSIAEEKSFDQLVENNALNMSLKHKSLTIRTTDELTQMKSLLEPILKEVQA